jgi:hypothetical protein
MKPHYIVVFVKNKTCTIRSMDEGITDIEWEAGCRIQHSCAISKTSLEQKATDNGYEVLDKQNWNEQFSFELREFYSPTFLRWDKWDKKTPIY